MDFYRKYSLNQSAEYDINEEVSDPLEEWEYVRSADYWNYVYNPRDIVLKYLHDPKDGKTYLYIDRKYIIDYDIRNQQHNLSWICYWDDMYSDDDLVYYLLSNYTLFMFMLKYFCF